MCVWGVVLAINIHDLALISAGEQPEIDEISITRIPEETTPVAAGVDIVTGDQALSTASDRLEVALEATIRSGSFIVVYPRL
jgi:hypothetical protein